MRLWPGVLIVALQWILRFGVPLVIPDSLAVAAIGGLVGGFLVALWWLFWSRAPWVERLVTIAFVAVALWATPYILDPSIATGMMGMMFYIYAIPGVSLALVLWAAFSRGLARGPRLASMAAAIVLACSVWALVQTGGFSGEGDSDFSWRWSMTAEDRLVAAAANEKLALDAAPLGSQQAAGSEASWPGFRGPGRDSVAVGGPIATNWAASPPVELWRRQIGPGWSSFAVQGNLVYTQEQRGDDEVVSCYNATTGEPIWRHADAVRFWESNAGAGPRGTPTLDQGRLYTLGATGVVNALDALDGKLIWSRNAASDTGAKLPDWGFSGSPLVAGDLLIVAASGRLVAYDIATGEPRWKGPEGSTSYSSPQLVTLDGQEQVLFLAGEGIASFAVADGKVLWQNEWKGYPIVQPATTADGAVLFSVNQGSGIRRLELSQDGGTFKATERWTSLQLKPYFNDFVVHKGHAYGFDGRILACVDVADGVRKWKGGRYGNGQLLLLPGQDLLLVLSELGELALVSAKPDAFEELAKAPAIEGKTWNHPVLVGDLLLVRNGEEMAAFRLPSP